tara:strand:- start:651 stop:887 length:237 start_codon:yes stop_codon:yes gene_type:complete
MTPEASFTDRELGAALQELQEVRHDYRNLRTIVTFISEQQEEMRLDHARLKTRLTTVVSAVVGLFTLVISILSAWKAG